MQPAKLESGYDLMNLEDQRRAMQVLRDDNPNVTMRANPCDPWSCIKKSNMG